MNFRLAIFSTFLMTGSSETRAIVKQNVQTAPVLSQADVMQWAVGLGLVIFLILVSAWLLRRFNQLSLSQGNRLKVLGGLSVGTRERVVLLQVGEKQLLLGVAPGRVETLHVLQPSDFTRAEDGNSNGSETGNFAERLKQTVRRQ